MPLLPDRSMDKDENVAAGAIRPPATNLSLGGVGLAGVTVVVTAWNTLFEEIFGADAAEATRKDVLVASIIALAVIIAADIVSRAITTAAAERSKSITAAASRWVVSPAPAGLSATVLEDEDESGFTVAALRAKPAEPEEIEYLVVKGAKAPAWKKASALKFG